MKKIMTILTMVFCAMSVFGQQRAAVLPFEVRNNAVSASEAQVFYGDFNNRFSRLGRDSGLFNVVPRGDVEKLFQQEAAFQLSNLSDSKKTAEYGKALNADWLISGSISKAGTRIVFMISMYTYPDFVQLDGSQVYARNIDELIDKIPELIGDIQGSMTRGGGRPAPRPSGTVSRGGVPEGFVLVEGGTFTMGIPSNEPDWFDHEGPQHQVTVKSFYMARHEVTQREWQEIMGTTVTQQRNMAQQAANDSGWPLHGEGDNYPMYYVSWYEAIEYCNKRSVKEGLTQAYRGSGNSITCDWNANGYRLPTEAEWEYAAKGGNKNFLTYLYSGSNSAGAVAWYDGNSGSTTHPVGTKAPNDLGLYDMSGNVWEWCWDWYGNYSGGEQTNPTGAVSGADRVMRGGSWDADARRLRSAYRSSSTPTNRYSDIGFRLVRP